MQNIEGDNISKLNHYASASKYPKIDEHNVQQFLLLFFILMYIMSSLVLNRLGRLAEVAMLVTYIWQFPGSNLGRGVDCLADVYCRSLQSPSG
jgi:hypothetical protein